MPVYEYECEECGNRIEHWQKMSDPPLSKCNSCGGGMHKVISQTTFHLKGSGWYVTDYAGGKKKNDGAGKKEGKASKKSDTSKGGSGTSDSGPAKSSRQVVRA